MPVPSTHKALPGPRRGTGRRPGFRRISGGRGRPFESLVQANAKAAEIWLQSWTRLTDESAGFLSKRWKQDLDLVDSPVSDNAILEAMVENPILINRPLVETERGVRLCRPQDTVLGIL